ncbi:hypothetical protein EPR50_G00175550 [Perca flavescens]|uniref:Uncharacterized protein n=1 Tax=Perca flavescens TaxID=8167 RepID=A0A484CAN0_PERFV|nr:hypothetical protein EPR50_G00175550 [Perca flavescens]
MADCPGLMTGVAGAPFLSTGEVPVAASPALPVAATAVPCSLASPPWVSGVLRACPAVLPARRLSSQERTAARPAHWNDSGHSEVEFDQEDLQGNCRHLNRDEEFQRKVMEMLVEMREDIRSLKKRDAEKYKATQIQQASTVEALNLLDRSLDSLQEKQKLMNALSRVRGVHLKDNVKRVEK